MWTGGGFSPPCYSARSRGLSRYSEEEKIVRDVSTLLDMTKTVLPLTIGLLAISLLRAQEISPPPVPRAPPPRPVGIVFVPPRFGANYVSGSIPRGVNL